MELTIHRHPDGLKTVEIITDKGSYVSDKWASPVAAMLDLKRKLYAAGFTAASKEIDCVCSNIEEFTNNGKNEYR